MTNVAEKILKADGNAGADMNQLVSLTFQVPNDSRDRLERLAGVYGVKGTLSFILDEAVEFLFSHESVYQDWREMRSLSDFSELNKTTFKTTRGSADKLERLAYHAGRRRRHPSTGELGGNVSWAVNEAVDFFLSQLPMYLAWRSGQILGVRNG